MKVLSDVWHAFNEDKIMRLAAAVAFSALFSLAPLLIVLIGIVGWFIGLQNGGHGHHVAEEAILDNVRQAAGPAAADTVRELVTAAFNKPRDGVVAQAIGWIAFAIGAASLFSSVQDALNAVWLVESPEGGWKRAIRDRLLSLAAIAMAALLLLGTTVLNARFAFAGAQLAGWIAQAVILGAAWVAFAAVYRLLPDVRFSRRDVWTGAGVTAVLFVTGEWLIALYLAKIGIASAYGGAGSLLAVLLWLYYSAIAFLTGAEFTKVSAGWAATTLPAGIRRIEQCPAGVDPRPSPARLAALRSG